MKILVTGTRDVSQVDLEKINSTLSKWESEEVTLIHGGASGVDWVADEIARAYGWNVKSFSADWERYGVGAGPIRNRKMLLEKPDLVIAFHYDPTLGKGTKDMVNIAKEAGVPVHIVLMTKDA